MKTLETQFTLRTHAFAQLKREADVAIYSQTLKSTGKIIAYEVIRVGSHNGYELTNAEGQKVLIAPAETYPGASSWGQRGWTFSDFWSALTKFDALVGLAAAEAAQTAITPVSA